MVNDGTPARDERDELRERIEAWTNAPLNVLSIVLLAIIVLELSPAELSPVWQSRVGVLNWFIYIVFSLDFFTRLLLATDRTQFLRRNWLAAISVLLPAFRVFRALRAVRALRGLRLVRVLAATNRGTRALNRILRGHQFERVLALTIAVTTVGAAALAYFEKDADGDGLRRYGDALWWALGFVTTVGGDFEPETLEGRIVTLLLIVWGLGVFGYVTGAVASYFVGQDAGGETASAEQVERLQREVTELRAMLMRTLEQRGER